MSIRIEEHAYAHMYQCEACPDRRTIKDGARVARYDLMMIVQLVNAVAANTSIGRIAPPAEERATPSVSVCAACLSEWVSKGVVARMVEKSAMKRRSYVDWVERAFSDEPITDDERAEFKAWREQYGGDDVF